MANPAIVVTVDETKTALENIAAAMHEQFPDERHAARLEQLDHHLSTAAMAVEHLFDEQARIDIDAARAERIRRAQEEE